MAGLKITRLATTDADFEAAFQRVRHWSADAYAQIEQRVAGIIADVRNRGDAAVLEYTARFDGLAAAGMADLTLGPADFQVAFDTLPVATLPRTGVGTTITMSATPATWAGTAFMIRLDG